MTRQRNSVNAIKGMCHVLAGDPPIISGNTGMFATVVRAGVGVYNITIDPELPIDPRDTVRLIVEGTAALSGSLARTGLLTVTCFFLTAAGVAADPTSFFALVIEGPSIG